MKPNKFYRIWFTPRTGSTLLCKSLEETGIAGKAGEFFTLFDNASLCEKYNVRTYDALKQRLWQEGTSSNGIFGIKLFYDKKIFDEIRTLRFGDANMTISNEALLADLFPKCKDIFITRRNKVRQAVSWWKAIKDQQWHLALNQIRNKAPKDFYEKNYDFDALSHLFKETNLRECVIQEYFSNHTIHPLTIVYEDFVANYEQTIHQLIQYLQLEDQEYQIKKQYFQKTANEVSENWVQEFRRDLQKEMNPKVW